MKLLQSNARLRLGVAAGVGTVPAAMGGAAICHVWGLSGAPLFLAAGVFALVCAAFTGFFLATWQQSALHRLAELIEALAQGEQRDSELSDFYGIAGRLADAVAGLGQRYLRMYDNQRRLVAELSDISGEVSVNAERVEANVLEQQRETESVATAMNEMSATVAEVAKLTSEAAMSAQEAQGATGQGMTIASGTREEIQRLMEELQQAAAAIHHLAEESQNIGNVLDVINSIAEQTNLLALNAAIEAARAGEQGRGFAVVADEVRTLASRTHSSTQEIEQMISRIQERVQGAVDVIQMASQRGGSGSEKMKETVSALEVIQKAVDHISNMNTQIATAAEEQSQVSEEINRNLVRISDLALTSVDSTVEGRKAAERLAQNAAQIRATL